MTAKRRSDRRIACDAPTIRFDWRVALTMAKAWPKYGKNTGYITLVPFAGSNLIRFNGSRITRSQPLWALRQERRV
jgi:hypothetical protein